MAHKLEMCVNLFSFNSLEGVINPISFKLRHSTRSLTHHPNLSTSRILLFRLLPYVQKTSEIPGLCNVITFQGSIFCGICVYEQTIIYQLIKLLINCYPYIKGRWNVICDTNKAGQMRTHMDIFLISILYLFSGKKIIKC